MVDIDTVRAGELSFLRHEHRDIERGLDEIHRIAANLERLPPSERCASIRRASEWAASVLSPHTAWEDKFVYSQIDDFAGTAWATKAARFDHFQLDRAAHELLTDAQQAEAPMTMDELTEVTSRLYGLEALIRSHLEREEALLLPALNDIWEVRRAHPRRNDP